METENSPVEIGNTPSEGNESIQALDQSSASSGGDSPAEPENSQTPEPEFQSQRRITEMQTPETVGTAVSQAWNSFASFRLDFQDRMSGEQREQQVYVEHLEKEHEKTWSGLDRDEAWAWILNQVEEVEAAGNKERSLVQQPAIAITKIRFLQPASVSAGMVVDDRHATPDNALLSNQPVALEVSFKVAGLGVSELAQLAQLAPPYQIQGKFHNRMAGTIIPLDSGPLGHLMEDQLSYTARLPEITLPAGPYQLQMIMTLHHSSISPAMFEVPILQVI